MKNTNTARWEMSKGAKSKRHTERYPNSHTHNKTGTVAHYSSGKCKQTHKTKHEKGKSNRMAKIRKTENDISRSRRGANGTLVRCCWEWNLVTVCGKLVPFMVDLQLGLLCNPAIPLLSICWTAMSTLLYYESSTSIFLTALFEIAKY